MRADRFSEVPHHRSGIAILDLPRVIAWFRGSARHGALSTRLRHNALLAQHTLRYVLALETGRGEPTLELSFLCRHKRPGCNAGRETCRSRRDTLSAVTPTPSDSPSLAHSRAENRLSRRRKFEHARTSRDFAALNALSYKNQSLRPIAVGVLSPMKEARRPDTLA